MEYEINREIGQRTCGVNSYLQGCGRRGSQLPRRAFSVVWGVFGLHLGRVVSADRRIGCFGVRYRAISGRCRW